MAHLSENSQRLRVRCDQVHDCKILHAALAGFRDVGIVVLPSHFESDKAREAFFKEMSDGAKHLGPWTTFAVLGDAADLVHAHPHLAPVLQYQLWIAMKRAAPIVSPQKTALPHHHFGALVYTRYRSALKHAKTRIAYSYCPACDKTTKDYGGKKHTYHEYGTLMSDVWRDIPCEYEGDLLPVFHRFADLFGIEPYHEVRVLDYRTMGRPYSNEDAVSDGEVSDGVQTRAMFENVLITGDCLKELKRLPDNCIDFAFADPPYNLRKNYTGYSDDRAITEYFAWCDEWITELARILKPGRTLALLNIPLWAIRHFLHLESVLRFQNWIVWDALSFPVRMIMPSHYAVLCFSKGPSRPLPGLTGRSGNALEEDAFAPLKPLAEEYCLRSQCVTRRRYDGIDDRGPLTDLWWDIHRLKHNSRRADHPCQLPSQLMYRLISIFTLPGETVLDCFNGAGTTTLAAHQLGRKYIGIEISKEYSELARERHREITLGMDPFRKQYRELSAKNSPVPRMPKQKYVIAKKELQLEVKRVAAKLGHLPSRKELATHGRYPIEYYDRYFVSWGEVCAAARTTGMSETRTNGATKPAAEQLSIFDEAF